MDRDGENPEVLYLYGVALSSTGQVTQAVWPLRRAMESAEWYQPAALHLAQLALATTDWDMAIAILDEMLEADPDNARTMVMRAYARAQSRQDYEGALVDADAVLAIDPENSDALVLRGVALLGLEKIDEAGEAIEAAAAHKDEVGLGLAGSPRFCAVRATFAKEKKEFDTAEEIFEQCLEEFPTDFLVADEAVQFFDARGRPDRSLEIIRAAFEAAPMVRSYRLSLVYRLGAAREHEEAERLMIEATEVEQPEAAAAAFGDLARYYFQREMLTEAIAAFEEALARVPEPGPEFLFTYADTLVAAGRFDDAVALTERMTVLAHRELVLGRVALEQGDPETALRHFTEGQRLWPNNAVSRYFSALAAEQLGDFDRAIEEFRYSIRTDASATDARLRLAKLYAAIGDDEQAVHVIRHDADDTPKPGSLPSTLYELELLSRLGRAQQLPPRLLTAMRPPEVWPSALAAMARGVRAHRGPAAAANMVLQADRLDLTHPANTPALWSLVEDQIALGQRGNAVGRVQAALRAHPEASDFHALRAFVLESAEGDAAEANASWKRAVELDPTNARALRGLAASQAGAGAPDEALALYARAADADAADVEALRASAAILAQAGRVAEAEQALERLLEREPYDGAASLELAKLMLERGAAADDSEVVLQLRRAERFGFADEANALLPATARPKASGQARAS